MGFPLNDSEYEALQKKYKDMLMPNEELSFTLRPHWRFIMVGVTVGVVLLVGLFLWRDLWANLLGTNSTIPIYIGVVIILFFFIKWTLRPVLQWIFTRYYFTTNRVMVRSGIFTRRASDIPLDKVSNVYYEKGPLDRLLGCGTLVIESSGGEGFPIKDVPNVERVTRDISILSEGGLPEGRLHGDGIPPRGRDT